jgi:glycerophosphoryl diester phosphodiesterase
MKPGPATVLAGLVSPFLCVPGKRGKLENIAFETSHALVSKELVDVVHCAGGGVYAFLTGFSCLLPAVDDEPPEELCAHLDRLKKAGVDGLMTDFPQKVSLLLDRSSASA